jgi:hypothetical protein
LEALVFQQASPNSVGRPWRQGRLYFYVLWLMSLAHLAPLQVGKLRFNSNATSYKPSKGGFF